MSILVNGEMVMAPGESKSYTIHGMFLEPGITDHLIFQCPNKTSQAMCLLDRQIPVLADKVRKLMPQWYDKFVCIDVDPTGWNVSVDYAEPFFISNE